MPIATFTITPPDTTTRILADSPSETRRAMASIGMPILRIIRSSLLTPRGWHKDRQMKRSTRQYETLLFSLSNAMRILNFVTIKFTDNPNDVGGASGTYTRNTRTILLDASLAVAGLNNPNLVSLAGAQPLPRPLTSAIHEMVHALDHILNLSNSDLGVKEGRSAIGGDYAHTIEQLRTLTLAEEPFAKAIQQWFTVQYSSIHGLFQPGNTVRMATHFSWASGGTVSAADALEWTNSGIYDNALQLIRRPVPAVPPHGLPKAFGGI